MKAKEVSGGDAVEHDLISSLLWVNNTQLHHKSLIFSSANYVLSVLQTAEEKKTLWTQLYRDRASCSHFSNLITDV